MSTITLSTPINDGKIKEITVRSPRMKDLRKHGLPFAADGSVDFDKAARLLESLTGTPMTFLDEMELPDTMACVGAIADSFGGDGAGV